MNAKQRWKGFTSFYMKTEQCEQGLGPCRYFLMIQKMLNCDYALSNKEKFCNALVTVALIDTPILVTADKGNSLNH